MSNLDYFELISCWARLALPLRKISYIITITDKIRFIIDDLVVGAFVGVGAVTHYTIAVALIGYFSQAMDSIFGVISPVLNKYHKLEQWDNLREVFLVVTELSVMIEQCIILDIYCQIKWGFY